MLKYSFVLHRRYRRNLDLFMYSSTFFPTALFSLSFCILSIETLKGDFG